MSKATQRNRTFNTVPDSDLNIGFDADREQNENERTGPSYAEIQLRAYYLYQIKGGSDVENWLEAEENLRQENSRSRKI